jgi:nonsense-mediated mRNA decay protein 3
MGNYFEAILQIRGLDGLADSDIEDLLQRIRDETYSASVKDNNVFITKEEKVRGGYDFYMGEHGFTRQLAQKLHEHYGGEMKWSSSLFGRKDGKDVYRHTFLVRLPGFLVGDYLVSEKGKFKVLKIFKRVQILDLYTRREITVDLSDAMAMRPMRASEVEMDLIVIMQTQNEVQVMHPTSMRPVDLIKHDESELGEKAKCVYIENELFLA